jgi:hypothetical protein
MEGVRGLLEAEFEAVVVVGDEVSLFETARQLEVTLATALLALYAGIQDAKEGKQGYLWAILSNPERRLELLHEGWRGARTPFLAAIVLDCMYQIITVRFVYPLELLFTATLLTIVPYLLLRGPFNLIARLFLSRGRASIKNGRKR